MNIVNINVIRLKSLQGLVDLLFQKLRIIIHDDVRSFSPMSPFGGDEHFVSSVGLFQNFSQNLLGMSKAIEIGGIKKINTKFQSLHNHMLGLFVADRIIGWVSHGVGPHADGIQMKIIINIAAQYHALTFHIIVLMLLL